jgi:hypothetical protein
MIYPTLITVDLPDETLSLVNSVFEEVCAELELKPAGDPLCEIVARRILGFVARGELDPDHIKKCFYNWSD